MSAYYKKTGTVLTGCLLGLLSACSGAGGDSPPGSAVGAASATGAATGVGGSTVAGSGGTSPGSGGTVSSSGGTTPGAGGDPVVTPVEVIDEQGEVVVCSTLERPPTPLRRLTRFEYNNTVQDLFSTDLSPADEFPPDEVADGFSNNALVLTISSLHAERYVFAAEALAAEAVGNLSQLLSCDPASLGERACAEEFARTFGRRAYRRELQAEDVSLLMEAYDFGDGFENGIEIMIRTMLQSPNFLFRVEFSGAAVGDEGMVRLDSFETATRLSYLLWSSAPDDVLLAAAAAGELSTAEQVEAQARRMLADPKARRAVAEFYRQWLELTRLEIVSKDVEAFPLWSDAMRDAMANEADAVIEQVVFGEEPNLQQLLEAPLGLPSGPLAELYAVQPSEQVTALSASERAGILTLPGFLSVQAHPDQTSPVLRGKFIRQKLLCTDVPPPPDDVDISPPEVEEGATARERFSAHAEGACATCHELMDPLGFALESYDAMGVFRTTDGGRELDLSGELVKTKAIDGPFNGAHEMVSILAGSDEVRDCVATQWFKFAMGRGVEEGDACSLDPLQTSFSSNGAHLRELLVSTTLTEAFLYRRASPAQVSP